jgi:SAM-dependent methyltransferase
MTQTQSNADQVAFWNGEAGEKWVKAQDRLDAMLAPVTADVLKAAAAKPGEHVLDIGCGCGETSIILAKAGARVTGIDISRPMLARAKQRAIEGRVDGFEAIEADASERRFEATYDLLVSRFGVMFFANADAAFANLRKALKPGGRLAFACWREPRANEWVSVPVGAIRPHVPPQPPLAPEDPGPFAFADLARVRRILANAGFDSIAARPFDSPMQLGETLEDALAHIQEFGPVSRMMTPASDDEKARAATALRRALEPYASKKPIALNGATWIVTAKA